MMELMEECTNTSHNNGIDHKCQRTKGHKGMCRATYAISWFSIKEKDENETNKIL